MKKINKKGFTLIELLAVIVVLAIVLVVTIPSVLTSMNSARAKQFENAVSSMQKWLQNQYESDQYGLADEQYKTFIENNKENLEAGKYVALTADIVSAAGLDPNDIDSNNSRITISNKKVEVSLVAKSGGKFSNNEKVYSMNTDNNVNLFDINKRLGVKTTSSNPNEKKDIYLNNYYYIASASGYYREDATYIIPEKFESNNISFASGNALNYYGIMVPFILNSNHKYKLSYTKSDNSMVSIVNLNMDGKCKETNSNGSCKSSVINSNDEFVPNNDGFTCIVFLAAAKNTEVWFENIELKEVE